MRSIKAHLIVYFIIISNNDECIINKPLMKIQFFFYLLFLSKFFVTVKVNENVVFELWENILKIRCEFRGLLFKRLFSFLLVKYLKYYRYNSKSLIKSYWYLMIHYFVNYKVLFIVVCEIKKTFTLWKFRHFEIVSFKSSLWNVE